MTRILLSTSETQILTEGIKRFLVISSSVFGLFQAFPNKESYVKSNVYLRLNAHQTKKWKNLKNAKISQILELLNTRILAKVGISHLLNTIGAGLKESFSIFRQRTISYLHASKMFEIIFIGGKK